MFKESVASIVDETIRQKYPNPNRNEENSDELRQQISKMETEIQSLRSLHAHNWKKRIDWEDQCESHCSALVTASETRLQQKIGAQKRAIKAINGSLNDVISSMRQPNYRNFGDSSDHSTSTESSSKSMEDEESHMATRISNMSREPFQDYAKYDSSR